jgi:hypothetical protein
MFGTNDHRDKLKTILDKYWPVFFGYTNIRIDMKEYKNPYCRFTDALLESEPEFWGAYAEGEYEKMLEIGGIADKLKEALKFLEEKFIPLVEYTEAVEMENLERIGAIADGSIRTIRGMEKDTRKGQT